MRHREADSPYNSYLARAARAAVSHTYATCAGRDLLECYLVLAWELQRRGLDPDPPTVFDVAVLVSRGERLSLLEED